MNYKPAFFMALIFLVVISGVSILNWLDDRAEAEAEAHRQEHFTMVQAGINKWFAWRRLADTVSVKDSLAADYNRFMDSLRTGGQEDEDAD